MSTPSSPARQLLSGSSVVTLSHSPAMLRIGPGPGKSADPDAESEPSESQLKQVPSRLESGREALLRP